MDKKLSKLFFIMSCVTMILIIVSLSFLINDKIYIEDISGERDALGDMNIVYQNRKGMYETDSTIISKDGEKTNKYVKEGVTNFPISNKNIDNRDLLQFSSDKSNICETDEEIMIVSLFNRYSSYNGNEMAVNIDIKNKKSLKIKKYEILIDDNINVNGDSIYKDLPIRKDDNIYLAVISSVYNKDTLEENKELDNESNIYKQTYLSLYKINLSSQQSKCIITKSYDPKEMYINGDVGFVKDNVAYFVAKIKDETSNKMNTSLFAFNVINKDIKIINLEVDNQNITNYYINNNEVLLCCEKTQIINKKIKTLVVNLKNEKVVSRSEIETKAKDNYNRYILDIRRDNEKIYIIMGDCRYDDYIDYSYEAKDTYYYIYVINEDNNETLYSGKIKQKITYNIVFGILKDNEL